jgi:hypothetical protein
MKRGHKDESLEARDRREISRKKVDSRGAKEKRNV